MKEIRILTGAFYKDPSCQYLPPHAFPESESGISREWRKEALRIPYKELVERLGIFVTFEIPEGEGRILCQLMPDKVLPDDIIEICDVGFDHRILVGWRVRGNPWISQIIQCDPEEIAWIKAQWEAGRGLDPEEEAVKAAYKAMLKQLRLDERGLDEQREKLFEKLGINDRSIEHQREEALHRTNLDSISVASRRADVLELVKLQLSGEAESEHVP